MRMPFWARLIARIKCIAFQAPRLHTTNSQMGRNHVKLVAALSENLGKMRLAGKVQAEMLGRPTSFAWLSQRHGGEPTVRGAILNSFNQKHDSRTFLLYPEPCYKDRRLPLIPFVSKHSTPFVPACLQLSRQSSSCISQRL